MLDDAVRAVLSAYPVCHAAFRRRQERDPGSGRRLSVHQAGILEHLDPDVPITVGGLAHRLRVTPATASLQLSQLARLRLVTREHDLADARRVHLRLTEAGVRLRGLRSMLDPALVRAALVTLAAAEQDAVTAGLQLLVRGAGELPPGQGESSHPPRSTRRSPKR